MADETNLDGQTFENRAATGSDRSRINSDGEYVENLPDPTEVRGLGGRRTSGGRLLPDLPETDLLGVNGTPAPAPEGTNDAGDESQTLAPKKAARSSNR